MIICSVSMFAMDTLKNAKNTAEVNVIVATDDIEKGSAITEKNIGLKSEEPDEVIQGAITDPKKVVGKIVNTNIYKGECILEQHIDTSDIVSPDTRIITLPITQDEGVLGVTKGDIVDLFSINEQNKKVEILLPAVKVIDVNKDDKAGRGTPYYISFEISYDNIAEILKTNITDKIYVVKYSKYSSPDPSKKDYGQKQAQSMAIEKVLTEEGGE